MTDCDYMNRAIKLAKKGSGWVNPNPLVGAVIVKNGHVIGEGFHERYGELHAERNAFASLIESTEGATLYVTLEPCCHYGKTPPCTEAILEHKIGRVVIGSRDPNPKVAGKGVAILRKAGIRVEEDYMKEECDRLNPIFFHYITSKTPYVIMKYAMTADGKIATKTGASRWITGEASRMEVQKLRHRCMGIMTGIGTVLADDPMLNVRIEGGKSPTRIICDSHLRIPLDSKICQSAKEYPTIVVCAAEPLEKSRALKQIGIQILRVSDDKGRVDLRQLVQILGKQKIDSILLEGGGMLNDSALQAGIVQEVQVFIAPKIFGGDKARTPISGMGVNLPKEAAALELKDVSRIDEDLRLVYKVGKVKTCLQEL